MRTKSSIGRINAVEHGGDINEVTALKFDEDGGFTMAVGSSGGKGIDGLGMVMNTKYVGQDPVGLFTVLKPGLSKQNLKGGGCKHLTHLSARYQAEFSSSFFLGAWWGGRVCGLVLLYDLRSSHPMRVKDHMYGSAILDIKWHRTLYSER
ncbi:hypothetical protein OIU77_018000 [Salix suchowensis]|uniref:Jacalin-type lectin domain-containing protein n=1 Tax=Salix suchowensis TaxID=1278906 RepID=A0ABQ8ZQW7_9ROSI|nr:hypothetical protein OIU77_018000 [Salix suchowensis]